MEDEFEVPEVAETEGSVEPSAVAEADPYAGTIFEGQPWEMDEGETPSVADNPPVEVAEGVAEMPTWTPPERVAVKVDGQEIEVPWDDLLAGYSRTADYTRKTQQVAEERRMLQPFIDLRDALRLNPEEGLRRLAAEFGISFDSPTQAPTHVSDDPMSWLEEPAQDDPVAARLAALEAAEAQRAADARVAQLQAQLDNLHAQFGEFDDFELVTYARDNGHPSLISAFRDLNFDRRQAAQEREAQDAEREAEQQRIIEQKRAASVVSGGSSRAEGSVKQPEPDLKKMSFREVAEYSLQQLKS